jgi:hypothetical protein
MTTDSIQISGHVTASAYSDEQLPDDWSNRTDSERLDYLRGVEPDEQIDESNVTTIGMHEYFAENLDPTDGTINLQADYLAIGTDDTTPDSSNRSLNAEYFRKQVSDGIVSGNELQVDTLIQSSEANGSTIREVGLFTDTSGGGNERMLNHAVIADIQKDNTRNITVEVTLTFSAA